MLIAGMLVSTALAAPPSWSEVAPILAKNCTPCHTGDGSGAYPLASAEELRRRRATVAAVLEDHSMPPWLPSNVAGTFLNELRLTEQDRALLAAWVDAGCVAPKDAARTVFTPTPRVEKIIASAIVGTGWSAAPEERDGMRSFAIPLGNDAPLRIRALRAKFVNPGHVGHVTFAVDNSGEAERLDALDGANGFKLAGDIGDISSGSLLGVGADGDFALPDGFAVAVPAHATLVAELHASGRGKVENAGFTVALIEADANDALLAALPVGTRGATRMQSTAPEIIVTESAALQSSYDVIAVIARPGRLATALQLTVQSSIGAKAQPLLTIPRYNGHRDRPYAFANPVRVERGSRLHLETTFETAVAAMQSTPECVLLVRAVPNAVLASDAALPSTPQSSTVAQQDAVRALPTIAISPLVKAMTHEVDGAIYELLLSRASLPRTGETQSAGATFFDAALWCNAASAAMHKSPCYRITQPQRVNNTSTTSAIVEEIHGDGFRLPTSAEWSRLAAIAETRDAAGSVWEWCEDVVGEARVVRGGSWADPSARRVVENSASLPPGSTNELFGFRAVIGPRSTP